VHFRVVGVGAQSLGDVVDVVRLAGEPQPALDVRVSRIIVRLRVISGQADWQFVKMKLITTMLSFRTSS
jgi:hypothetical protein